MKLTCELGFLRDLFQKNGYSAGVVNKYATADLTVARNLDRHVGNRCVLHLLDVGTYNLDIECRVRALVCRAFGDVNAVTLYSTRRAFMVKKDVVPTDYLSKAISVPLSADSVIVST